MCELTPNIHRGFARNIWMRYYGCYTDVLVRLHLKEDLNQEIELATILAQEAQTKERADSIIQKEFGSFLKSLGYSWTKTKRVFREQLFSPKQWQHYQEKGFLMSQIPDEDIVNIKVSRCQCDAAKEG